jgi:hypothetical protein
MTGHHCILRASGRREEDSEWGGPDTEAGFAFSGALKKFRIYISRDVKGSARGVNEEVKLLQWETRRLTAVIDP